MLRNDLDSAGMTFQYINFAFAPKEEGGYDIPIGSNASNDKGEFSIASNEKGKTGVSGQKLPAINLAETKVLYGK